jgi:prepilin-type processing-associated H-X9-DG protein
MFAEIRAAAALLISDVLALPPTEAGQSELRSEMIPASEGQLALRQAWDFFQGPDGRVSPASVGHAGGVNTLMADGSVQFLRHAFWLRLKAAMRLGAYRENWEAIPGVAFSEVNGTAPETLKWFSIPTVSRLVDQFVTDAGCRNTLQSLLQATRSAVLRGNLATAKNLSKQFADAVKAAELATPPQVSPTAARVMHTAGDDVYQWDPGDGIDP